MYSGGKKHIIKATIKSRLKNRNRKAKVIKTKVIKIHKIKNFKRIKDKKLRGWNVMHRCAEITWNVLDKINKD